MVFTKSRGLKMIRLVFAAVLMVGLTTSPDPLRLTKPAKAKHVEMIVEYAEKNNHDPYELLAIAITESSMKPKAVSRLGAIGLFQIMCKYWYEPLKYKTIKECNKALFDPRTNMKAGILVLTTYRNKYKQCKGDLAYRCYFAGQNWQRHSKKVIRKVVKYENKVKENRGVLHKYYKSLIENIRANFRSRS